MRIRSPLTGVSVVWIVVFVVSLLGSAAKVQQPVPNTPSAQMPKTQTTGPSESSRAVSVAVACVEEAGGAKAENSGANQHSVGSDPHRGNLSCHSGRIALSWQKLEGSGLPR